MKPVVGNACNKLTAFSSLGELIYGEVKNENEERRSYHQGDYRLNRSKINDGKISRQGISRFSVKRVQFSQ